MGAQDETDMFGNARSAYAPPRAATQTDAQARQAHDSALSWRAVLAGAAAAAALSLILLILGMGLGLSSVSPWTQAGISAASFGVSTILWITLTQVAASGMGGYLAGRLRDKWTIAVSDETYFRDTAHGFLAWAIATLATAALLTSAIGNILGHAAQAGALLGGGAVGAASTAMSPLSPSQLSQQAQGSTDSSAYFVDALFRRNPGAAPTDATATNATPNATTAAATTAPPPIAEAARIFANSGHSATLPPVDVQYLGQLVAQNTGVSQQDAEKRVSAVYASLQDQIKNTETAAREAADKARKASAYAALWLFVSLLGGAFVASLAATFGGRQRDA